MDIENVNLFTDVVGLVMDGLLDRSTMRMCREGCARRVWVTQLEGMDKRLVRGK